ncbi:Cd(II)/Pb(II)-responsive transcriptional regulator [Glaciimonas sp. PCH181]|uniref:Cd(II)/Pb(II)-responsive transcriptional regulator n=1 Tax=Glaciimonas sp. PCH181 TaxID=2133943 RepID=UPI000D38CD56|nr:Cd(II)/Pb(II)-responsive transcriptional regulator [Glaciimonas sp. PCH181]PUA20240.1 Cd(II)/Pb(II)-responsive transcriptional regulator [Glaciimonas sp. PCH181]
MTTPLKIGELSSHAGCPVETIRYYEREGLLPAAARSQGNYRLYGPTHIERLQFIRHCRSLDMTLDEVRSLLQFRDLPEENCAQINTLLDHHIDHVASRITELKALQSQLKQLRKQCHSVQAAKDCGILQGLANMEDDAPANLGSHGGGCH